MQDFTDTPTQPGANGAKLDGATVSAPIFSTPSGAIAHCDAVRALDAATDVQPNDDTLALDAENFPSITPQEIALLERNGDAPQLKTAARALLEIMAQRPDYETGNPRFGRFGLASYSDSAKELRATFRVLRASLDFLEADYLACEAEQREFWRGEIEKLDAMRGTLATEAATS